MVLFKAIEEISRLSLNGFDTRDLQNQGDSHQTWLGPNILTVYLGDDLLKSEIRLSDGPREPTAGNQRKLDASRVTGRPNTQGKLSSSSDDQYGLGADAMPFRCAV